MPLDDYGPDMFGKVYAETYDQIVTRSDAETAAQFLSSLAGSGLALELAIGTGRIALPLAARGVEVQGIDASEIMVAKMRAKPGGDALSVTIGNFADVAREGPFSLIYIVFNALFNLSTQDEQVRCFQNVAERLSGDGVFVVEAFVPNLNRFGDHGGCVHAEGVETGSVALDVAQHDAVNQLIHESHVLLTTEGVKLYPMLTRYSWPSELDLMARLAGLQLQERHSGWNQEPFTGESKWHVSVYGRDPRRA